jgi:hypothetical protein
MLIRPITLREDDSFFHIRTKDENKRRFGNTMGWWPFAKKSGSKRQIINDPLRKDTRVWLSELRDICEMNFDNPEAARRQIRQMQVDWHQAFSEGVLPQYNREGLESRAFRLLSCSDDEWITWLDNDSFWKPGWRPEQENNED